MAPDANYTKYLGELKGVMDEFPLADLKRAADILFHAYENDRAIFLFGNGGSAALASHLATDLAKGTHFPGPPSMKNVRRMRVLALTDNTPLMTAWSNDFAYEHVFAGQLENFVRARDVAFGISGSGNSPNVLRALELARRTGAITVGFAGFGGGKMKDLLDCAVVLESQNMQVVEDAHVILSHLLFLDLKARIEASAAATTAMNFNFELSIAAAPALAHASLISAFRLSSSLELSDLVGALFITNSESLSKYWDDPDGFERFVTSEPGICEAIKVERSNVGGLHQKFVDLGSQGGRREFSMPPDVQKVISTAREIALSREANQPRPVVIPEDLLLAITKLDEIPLSRRLVASGLNVKRLEEAVRTANPPRPIPPAE